MKLKQRVTQLTTAAVVGAGRLWGDPLSGFYATQAGKDPYGYYDAVRRRPLMGSRIAKGVGSSSTLCD